MLPRFNCLRNREKCQKKINSVQEPSLQTVTMGRITRALQNPCNASPQGHSALQPTCNEAAIKSLVIKGDLTVIATVNQLNYYLLQES